MLTFKEHAEVTALKCRKGLTILRAMAAKGIEQRHLFKLYQSVVLSRMDYGLGLTTIAATNMQKLERVQNEAMRTILGTTKDTPTEAMRYLLDLPPLQERQKVAQVKAYLNAVENPSNPLHQATKYTRGDRLQRGKSWMGQAEDSIRQMCELKDLKTTKEWQACPTDVKHLTQINIAEQLGRHCRDWAAGRTEAEVRAILEQITKRTDFIVYTDGSVTKGKSGWGYVVKQSGVIVQRRNGAYGRKTSSMTMEVEAITNTLDWLANQQHKGIACARCATLTPLVC